MLNKSKSFFHYDFFARSTRERHDTTRFFSALWRSAVVAAVAAVDVVFVAGFSFIKPASANFAQPQKSNNKTANKKRQ